MVSELAIIEDLGVDSGDIELLCRVAALVKAVGKLNNGRICENARQEEEKNEGAQ